MCVCDERERDYEKVHVIKPGKIEPVEQNLAGWIL